jgi:hypothetical protein
MAQHGSQPGVPPRRGARLRTGVRHVRFRARRGGNRLFTMTPRRSESYGQVMRTLREVGDAKLHPDERELVREAADALLFCGDLDAGPEARMALDDIVELTRRLAETGRWTADAADELLEDVAGCGPVLLLV